MKLQLNKEHIINLVNIIPFTAVLPLLAIHSENKLNIYIVDPLPKIFSPSQLCSR